MLLKIPSREEILTTIRDSNTPNQNKVQNIQDDFRDFSSQMQVPSTSQLMDLFRQTMPTLPKPPKQDDEDDREMNEEEKDANDELRYTFATTLRNLSKSINADEPESLLDEFDFLVSLVKPSQVEYLAAFLEGSLIPSGVTMINQSIDSKTLREWSQLCEKILFPFTQGVSDLFKLFETYHRTGKTFDEVKLMELHLNLLVTLKTEMCHESSRSNLFYRPPCSEGQESTGTDDDGKGLTLRALDALLEEAPRFVKVGGGWIIHFNIGPRLIHAIHAIRLIRIKYRIDFNKHLEATPKEDTSTSLCPDDFRAFHTHIDAMIRSEFIAKMRPDMAFYGLEKEIYRIITYYRKFYLMKAHCIGVPRCLGLERKGDRHCFVRELCELAIPYIVAKCNSLIPGKVVCDVFNIIVIKIAQSMGIDLKTDDSREYTEGAIMTHFGESKFRYQLECAAWPIASLILNPLKNGSAYLNVTFFYSKAQIQ
ncbi:hypothetical protein BLS_004037 [Venturia inaequalis]|uniref:Uncharacterized protein n=1 Tax=Venturia inaequalis TaxID=5025 RepID=A0A8H3VTC0_VENIN|nr:hypothetical protein BLS_004037 [Venturia inaequalis]KAE9993765.1 hypothetical protein EG327_003527 [Venturia inaequalis]